MGLKYHNGAWHGIGLSQLAQLVMIWDKEQLVTDS